MIQRHPARRMNTMRHDGCFDEAGRMSQGRSAGDRLLGIVAKDSRSAAVSRAGFQMRTHILGVARRNVRYAVAAAALALAIAQPRGAQGTKRKRRQGPIEDVAPDSRTLANRLQAALRGNEHETGFHFQKVVAIADATDPFVPNLLRLLTREGGILELSAGPLAKGGRGRLFLRTRDHPDVVRIITVSAGRWDKGPRAEMRRPRGLNKDRMNERHAPYRMARLLIGSAAP